MSGVYFCKKHLLPPPFGAFGAELFMTPLFNAPFDYFGGFYTTLASSTSKLFMPPPNIPMSRNFLPYPHKRKLLREEIYVITLVLKLYLEPEKNANTGQKKFKGGS